MTPGPLQVHRPFGGVQTGPASPVFLLKDIYEASRYWASHGLYTDGVANEITEFAICKVRAFGFGRPGLRFKGIPSALSLSSRFSLATPALMASKNRAGR